MFTKLKELIENPTVKVCFDVDEVFLDHIVEVFKLLREDGSACTEENKNFKVEDFLGFNQINELFGEQGQKFFKLPEAYYNMTKLLPGSKELFFEFERIVGKDRIQFITHSHDETEQAKEDTLERLLRIDIDSYTVIHSYKKNMHYLGNISIDDSLRHYKQDYNGKPLIEYENTIGIMPLYTHNKDFQHQNIIKVSDNYKELLDFLSSF